MKTHLILYALACTWLFIGAGCTGTGRLADGERLYTGAKIKIEKSDKNWSTNLLKSDLKKAIILPRPNKKILWMRPKLVLYELFKNSREKSFGTFIAYKLGEKPVFYEPNIAKRQQELLEERAGNDGYFSVKVESNAVLKKHKASIGYQVTVLADRKKVDHIDYPDDSSRVTAAIAALQSSSVLNPGAYYQLENLIAERQRISDTLRNHGWYFFTPDNLIFEADTLHPIGTLNLHLRLKRETSAQERQQYEINTIVVYPDYDLAKEQVATQNSKDTLDQQCPTYIYDHLHTKPSVLNQQIKLRCGSLYSNEAYQSTVYRLLSLNIYKFINIRFEVSPREDTLLDARIYLTNFRPQRIESTVSGIFSAGFYYGARTGLAYNHRNLFGGAVALRVAVNAAYLRTNNDNYDFQDFIVSDASVRMSLPRFVFFKPKDRRSFSKTTIGVRHETNWFKYDLPELGAFRMSLQRVSGEAGYSWKNQRSGSITQEFNPINLGLQFSTFNKALVRQKVFENIPSDTTGTTASLLSFLEYKPNYTFTLDERLGPNRQLTRFIRLRVAGQISGYRRNQYLPADYKLASPRNFFIETDYRQYQKTTAHHVLAMRLAIGAGIPLRTGGTIALLDRYIVGGASSVRAFAPRTIGPGTQPRDTSRNTLSVSNYTGNLLIESSIEYRIALGRYPELAFFLDAGNIWLTAGPDATEASKFHVNSFYRALALGSGMGLRINLGFFVLRLDVAFPLSKPYLPVGERWVGDQLRFGSGLWRKENLNWNFSFGLPF